LKNLSQSVETIQVSLAKQISEDFKDAFSVQKPNANATNLRLNLNQLAEACKVISVLDSKVKKDLLKWFISSYLV